MQRADDRAATSSPRRSGRRSTRPSGSSTATRSRSSRSSTPTARLRGLITVKDISKRIEYPDATKDEQGRLRVGAAVGVGPDALERAEALVAAGRRRARPRHRARALDAACSRWPGELAHASTSSSSPATSRPPRRAAALIAAGVDGVKVGSGPGVDLHDPRRRRRRRPAGDRGLRVRPRLRSRRRPADRRRRDPQLRRRREGDRRRRRHGDARLRRSPAPTRRRAT